MRIPIPWFLAPFYERDKSGQHNYLVDANTTWGVKGTPLAISQDHPILTPGILFVSKLFSQAEFFIENKRTQKKVDKHWLLDLLNDPNYYQHGMDFLESLMFMQIAQGKTVIYAPKDAVGFSEPSAFYLLNSDLIEYPEEFKTPMNSRRYDKTLQNSEIVYDKYGENKRIKFSDLLWFYDLPNCLNKNRFESKSRLDGLKQTLINTNDSLLAKNIILKTNGKELITQKKAGFPLSDGEKEDAERLFNANYGLSGTRKRGLITRADLSWQSLHIALRDLGLDESVKVDGNLIYTALHIPKDILSLEAKKTTYNNFKESMVSYIQNEMQPSVDATCAVLQKLITEPNLVIKATYTHLPIMQFILLEKFEGLIKKGQAISSLRSAGLPDEIVLEECGYDKSITLNEMTQNGNQATNSEGAQGGGNEEGDDKAKQNGQEQHVSEEVE